jgi:hypothetical protein
MTMAALCVAIVMASHQIHNVKSINSPNNDQHEVLGSDSLLDLWREILA